MTGGHSGADSDLRDHGRPHGVAMTQEVIMPATITRRLVSLAEAADALASDCAPVHPRWPAGSSAARTEDAPNQD